MSDAQLTLILAALATLGGSLIAALRWAVNRVTGSNDAGTRALIDNTASNAVLIVKVDTLIQSNTHLAGKLDDVADFVEEHTPVRQQIPKKRAQTPVQGIHQWHRGTTKDDK